MAAQLELDLTMRVPDQAEAPEATWESLLECFGDWMVAGDRPGVAWAVAGALRFKADYLDGRLDSWRARDLTEILLELFPRKVTADEADIALVCPTLRAFFEWLAQVGLLHPDGDALPGLLAELDRIEPDLLAAMTDTSAFGPAKSVTTAMMADGVDLEDDAAVQAWIADYNDTLRGWPPARHVLPPMAFPDKDTLAALATAACQTLVAGDAPERLAAAPLDAWRDAMVALLAEGTPSRDPGVRWWSGRLDDFAPIVLLGLHVRGASTVDQLADDTLANVAAVLGRDGEGTPPADTAAAMLADVRLLVDRLSHAGAVERREKDVDLTALGKWFLREALRPKGVEIPDVAELDAAGLIDACAGSPGGSRAIDDWIAVQGAEAAAAQLAALVAATDDDRVLVHSLAALEHVGPAAESSVRGLRHRAGCRSFAAVWLVKNGFEEDQLPDPDEAVGFVVDDFRLLLAVRGPQVMAERFASCLSTDEQEALLAVLWRDDDPHVDLIFDAIAAHAPAPTAKAAKRARFKRRTSAARR